MKNKKEELKGKYWICDECAKEKGWISPDGAVTGVMGKCGWCKGKNQITRFLVPTCDYGQSGKQPIIWD